MQDGAIELEHSVLVVDEQCDIEGNSEVQHVPIDSEEAEAPTTSPDENGSNLIEPTVESTKRSLTGVCRCYAEEKVNIYIFK